MGQSRNENILENMLGGDNSIGAPQSRNEELLIEILNQGAGLPDVTEADDGKVLAVVNGEWDKAELPEGNLPVTTAADNGKVLAVEDGEWAKSDNYAQVDGYYEGMSVGNAEQLISNITVEDKEPYNFRTAGGALEIGDRVNEKTIVGGTVAWRQMAQLESEAWTASNVSLSFDTMQKWITLTSTKSASDLKCAKIALAANYVYYISGSLNNDGAKFGFFNSNNVAISDKCWVNEGSFATIYKAQSGDYFAMRLDDDAAENASAGFEKVMLFNLTRLFGVDATADYFNTLESASSYAGVRAFRNLFPKDYYEGSADYVLQSVNVSKKIAVGFNAYNHATGTARIIGSKNYQITGAYTSLLFTPDSGIGSYTFEPSATGDFYTSNNGVLTVTGGNSTTTCVHLRWDGERDDEFEPYVEHEYALDDSLSLNGLIKFSGVKLQNSGDVYYNDGTVKRVYGHVDLGTLTPKAVDWRTNSNGTGWYYDTADIKVKAPASTTTKANMICSGLITRTYAQVYGRTAAGIAGNPDNSYVYVWQNDTSLNTKAKVKAAMAGVYLVWEKYSATTESAEPYREMQIVDNWGTEEFVDYAQSQNTREIAVPVGHTSDYPIDIKAKVEVAPESPDADGLYLMQRENGANSYVPKASDRFIITVDDQMQTDVTFDEALAAYQAGKQIVLNITFNGRHVKTNLNACIENAIFTFFAIEPQTSLLVYVSFDYLDVITIYPYGLTPIS